MFDHYHIAYCAVGVAVALCAMAYDRFRRPAPAPWSESADPVKRWTGYVAAALFWPADLMILAIILVAAPIFKFRDKYRYRRESAPVALRWLLRP